jgi:ABC-type transport system involved in multi-copper enzyme maturation permease subunit
MTQAPMSALRQIFWIGRNTLVEALRQRFFLAIALLVLSALGSASFLAELDLSGAPSRVLADVGLGALSLFGMLLAMVATAQVFYSEVENRTLLTLLSMPVSRGAFILGKVAGVGTLLAIFTTVMGALLALLMLMHRPEVSGPELNLPLLALGVFSQWIGFMVVSAWTVFIASYAQSALFTLLMAAALTLAGLLQPLAAEAASSADHTLSRLALSLVSWLVPNLQAFRAIDSALLLGEAMPPASFFLSVSLYGGGTLLVLWGLSVWLFQRRAL